MTCWTIAIILFLVLPSGTLETDASASQINLVKRVSEIHMHAHAWPRHGTSRRALGRRRLLDPTPEESKALALKEIPHYLPGLDTTAEGAPAKEWDQLAARWSALQAGSLIRIYLTPVLDRHLLPPCGKRSPTLLSQSKPQFKEAESFEEQDGRSADVDVDLDPLVESGGGRQKAPDPSASDAKPAAAAPTQAAATAASPAPVAAKAERSEGAAAGASPVAQPAERSPLPQATTTEAQVAKTGEGVKAPSPQQQSPAASVSAVPAVDPGDVGDNFGVRQMSSTDIL